MTYADADLPVVLHEAEFIVLSDGTQIRFEESGGARDVFINDEWSPRIQLYPSMEYTLETGAGNYLLVADELSLKVDRL